MIDLKQKLIESFESDGPKKLWDILLPHINPQTISNPEIIEFAMSSLISQDKINLLMKHLQVDNVPPLPIDTQFDKGRRFFYLLYILNKNMGFALVKSYLENIVCHREQEFRFLGGIYFNGLDLEKSLENYKMALSFVDVQNVNKLMHRHIFHNLMTCLAYLEKIDEFNEYTKTYHQVLIKTDSQNFYRMKIYSNILSNKLDEAKRVFNSNYGYPVHIKKGVNPAIINLQTAYFAKQGDEEKFYDFFTTWYQIVIESIRSGSYDSTRGIASSLYLFNLAGLSHEHFFDFVGKETKNYPIFKTGLRNCYFDESERIEVNDSSCPNYLYPKVEEFKINDRLGIGLTKEIKAIYFLILAGDLGMSYYELSYHINGEHDFAGLFMVRARIKQILFRIDKLYKVKTESKNFRAYLPKEERLKFHVSSISGLSIKYEFQAKEFSEYYKVSSSKTKKVLKELSDSRKITAFKKGRSTFYKKNNNYK